LTVKEAEKLEDLQNKVLIEDAVDADKGIVVAAHSSRCPRPSSNKSLKLASTRSGWWIPPQTRGSSSSA